MTKLQKWVLFDTVLLLALLGLLFAFKWYIDMVADQQIQASQSCPDWQIDLPQERCK